ncbi:MAG TPA: ribose-5-phosphate isomerase RpiA [Gemmataceae bacterium]|jgi:ribose 5-phosphate isomerase A
MTIYERAVELVADGAVVGLGSGRAAEAFVQLLGDRIRAGKLAARGLPTSSATAHLALRAGIPLVTPAQVPAVDLTVDGADEVDPHLDLIKGYGRRLVREKVVAAMGRRLVILVGDEKLVPVLGTRGRLPVEVVPFALPLCERRLRDLQCPGTLYTENGAAYVTDNGNHILDCAIGPLDDPAGLERDIRAIPGVVDTGLFLDMADVVLVGDRNDFRLLEERKRR